MQAIKVAAMCVLAGLASGCKSKPAPMEHEAGPSSLGEIHVSYTVAPPAAPTRSDLPPIFNGKDLTGWKGLVADPKARAKMSAEALAKAQAEADQRMRDHWNVLTVDGTPVLHFDGKGDNLCTARDYASFEMLVDWKIPPKGDSGIYVRGSPQVQIWDNPLGSGGLYNNQKNPSNPLVVADKKVGEWNTFRIRMVGERVSVWLNGQLVVDDVILENYWERDKPVYPRGAIELQNHGGELWFRNIFGRELTEAEVKEAAGSSRPPAGDKAPVPGKGS